MITASYNKIKKIADRSILKIFYETPKCIDVARSWKQEHLYANLNIAVDFDVKILGVRSFPEGRY